MSERYGSRPVSSERWGVSCGGARGGAKESARLFSVSSSFGFIGPVASPSGVGPDDALVWVGADMCGGRCRVPSEQDGCDVEENGDGRLNPGGGATE